MKRKIIKLAFLSLIIICAFSCKKEAIVPTGVTVSPAILSLEAGSTGTIVATVSPSDAEDPTVFWNSDNPSIAQVSASGVVTAVKAGSAKIIATTAVGYKSAFCTLTVTPLIIAVTGIAISPESLSLKIGDTDAILATVSPSNASDPTVNWNSDHPAIATVSSSGVVTAVAAGSAIITATTADGNKTASCAVTVQDIVAINLIVNPGFEDLLNFATTWTEDWGTSKLNITSARTGIGCLEVGPSGDCGRAQIIKSGFTVGSAYKFTFWVKHGDGGGTIFPGVICSKADGKDAGNFPIEISVSAENANKWVQYSIEFVIPEETVSLMPNVWCGVTTTVLMDDFSLTLK